MNISHESKIYNYCIVKPCLSRLALAPQGAFGVMWSIRLIFKYFNAIFFSFKLAQKFARSFVCNEDFLLTNAYVECCESIISFKCSSTFIRSLSIGRLV